MVPLSSGTTRARGVCCSLVLQAAADQMFPPHDICNAETSYGSISCSGSLKIRFGPQGELELHFFLFLWEKNP